MSIHSSTSTASASTEVSTSGSPAAGLFKGPLRTIWNVQGENVMTLWWPAKDGNKQGPGSEPGLQQQPRTVLFMLPASHLGHTSGPHVKDPSRLYTLQEQVDNKIAIFDALRERYPSNTRFVVAGHSMGAWLSLQVLKARPNHQIERIFGLFPTVHHILDTPNGQNLKNMFKPTNSSMIAGVVSTLRFVFSAPPVLKAVVRLATGQDPEMAQITARDLLHGHVVKNCLFLAGQEMEAIRELDEDLVQQHGHKFVFYYGKTDEWSPIEHYYDMRDRFPQVKSHLCSQGMKHAFVIGHGEAMGALVGEWIDQLSSC
ncbi:hypothetical protein DFQ27_006975 [Actinomortierella ambigua]|uniref:Uncharacterized protein n=1 Tax=Actinomortierella ambigua TaxID=1343610 RepID=A0A9P6QJ24_9FUNG|nr:hypothetical protein DFQ27_006975 [Actinomortierella ambigua]